MPAPPRSGNRTPERPKRLHMGRRGRLAIDDLYLGLLTAGVGAAGTVLGAVVSYWLAKRRMSDKEILMVLRGAFDRRAFWGKYQPWTDASPFLEAMRNVRDTIAMGAVRHGPSTIQEGKGLASLRSAERRRKLEEVLKRLVLISDLASKGPSTEDSAEIAGREMRWSGR